MLMANHSDPRTREFYYRRKDLATFSEIERRRAFELIGAQRRPCALLLVDSAQ